METVPRPQERSLHDGIKGIEGELARRKRDEPIRYYGPHPKQLGFHANPSRIRCVSGGNRSGKTKCGCAEDVAHAVGYRPWYPPDHPDYWVKRADGEKIEVPNRGIIIGESFGEQVKKVLVPELVGDPEKNLPGLIPKSWLRTPIAGKGLKKNQQGIITQISLNNGSVMDIQSYDQDPDLFEGTKYHWAHTDEPSPRAVFIATWRGLTDKYGSIWMTMTPLKEAWIWDELHERAEGEFSKVSIWFEYMDMYDNIGYGLTLRQCQEFEAMMTPEEAETRVHGKPSHMQGLVYKEFRKEKHLCDRPNTDDYKVPATWGIWMHLDTHDRKAHAAVWVAIRPDDIMLVIGELKNTHPQNMIEPFLDDILCYEQECLGVDSRDVERLIDPYSKVPSATSGISVWDLCQDAGFGFKEGSKEPRAGRNLLHQRLSYDEFSMPTIRFYRDLKATVYEITHYQWKDWTTKQSQDRGLREEVKKKDDDLLEGIHRILCDEPSAPNLLDYDDEEPPRGTGTNGVGY